MLLATAAFLAMLASWHVLGRLGSGPLGEAIVLAAAAEFDTETATVCDLSPDEAELAAAKEAPLRAIFPSTSQDKATLVRIPRNIYGDVRGKPLTAAPRRFTQVRTASCHVPTAAGAASGVASAATAPKVSEAAASH